ncbi:alpha/beta fold hydrolase [Holophaga foetida]|uniref:alpha/beta fold hydrolase n=1 Tax=Holophaga foetida TaxID=35839 RepID=UPI0002474D5D|nr:alpha/beta fold hydrolase [Holophaga foetida]
MSLHFNVLGAFLKHARPIRPAILFGMSETTTLLPDDLEPTFRGVMLGRGNAPLAFCRWDHPSPRGRVVLAHGYGEHSERYRHTAHWLHSLGWSVSAMDHCGFGRSAGIRGDADGIRGFVEDLTCFLRQERHHDAPSTPRMVDGVPAPAPPTHPQVLLGHSFGGLVALLALLWHPDAMEGLVLTSPALRLRNIGLLMRLLQRLLYCLAPHRPLDLPGDKSRVCSDPILVQRYWADPLCHHFVTAAFPVALDEGRRVLMGLGQELDRPILLLEAGNDTVVDPGASEDFWDSVPAGLLERHTLTGFLHEVLHDLRRNEAQALVEAWLMRLGNPTGTSAMSV